jgi:hypothetical protein
LGLLSCVTKLPLLSLVAQLLEDLMQRARPVVVSLQFASCAQMRSNAIASAKSKAHHRLPLSSGLLTVELSAREVPRSSSGALWLQLWL